MRAMVARFAGPGTLRGLVAISADLTYILSMNEKGLVERLGRPDEGARTPSHCSAHATCWGRAPRGPKP
jgi:hypothetical protein